MAERVDDYEPIRRIQDSVLRDTALRHAKAMDQMTRDIAQLREETRAGRATLLRRLDEWDARGK